MIVGLATAFAPKMCGLVLAVWFTCRSSTGSRRVVHSAGLPNLRCPRNGKWTGLRAPLLSDGHWAREPRTWEGGRSCSISPDTGQQGGGAPRARHRDAHAPAGKPVRAFALVTFTDENPCVPRAACCAPAGLVWRICCRVPFFFTNPRACSGGRPGRKRGHGHTQPNPHR